MLSRPPHAAMFPEGEYAHVITQEDLSGMAFTWNMDMGQRLKHWKVFFLFSFIHSFIQLGTVYLATCFLKFSMLQVFCVYFDWIRWDNDSYYVIKIYWKEFYMFLKTLKKFFYIFFNCKCHFVCKTIQIIYILLFTFYNKSFRKKKYIYINI